MGSTTIRIRSEDKARLRKLQRAVEGAGGKAASQTDLLAAAIGFAQRNRDRFVLEATWAPLTAAEIAAFDRLATDLGPWSAEDVDATVYDQP